MEKYTNLTHHNVEEFAKQNEAEVTALFKKLKKKKPKNLDDVFHNLHEEAFDNFDCLDCANCCSSISPIVREKDIDRLAKNAKVKAGAFIDQYLHVDRDGDYVFKETPCPFLMPDNYCMCYEARPKACREYPHTDRNKIYQILSLTATNRSYCPIVYMIVEELKKMNW